MGDCNQKGNGEGWGLGHKKCTETPNYYDWGLASIENPILPKEND